MQASGQYGVPDQQFVMQRPPPHMFTLSHDIFVPATAHGHPLHLQHPQHQQQQHPQHLHSQHAQHPSQQQQAMVQQLGLGLDSPPEVPSLGAGGPSPTSYQQRESVGDDDGGEEEGRGTGGNRWPRQETLALIKIRSEMDGNFRDSGLKGPLWEDVSRKMAELGYQRSSKKCKEKFENIHKYYKKTKDGRGGRQDGKSYRFFSQLEALYGGGMGNSNDPADGGRLILAGGNGESVCGDRQGSVSLQRPAENSSGLQLSSDSEEDDDDPGDNDEQEKSRKRKRKERKEGNSKVIYFESLVKKLIEKQEAMQRKFLDTIERREHDRLVREEAWKRQEMARITREHELRAQEHALATTRDAALVAFLQKVTGQTLQLPHISPPQPLSLAVPETDLMDDQQEKDSSDPNSKRWPKPEVQALIRLRSQMEPRFQEAGPKGCLWDEISSGMACVGYNRNAKRCKEKWENINKYFRKTKETNKKRAFNAKTCPYFQQLDVLYRKGVLGTPSIKLHKPEDNSDGLVDRQSNREDSEHCQGDDAEGVLEMMPTGPCPSSVPHGGETHFFASPDNESDRCSKKTIQPTQILTSPSNGDHSSAAELALNFDGLHRDDESFSGKESKPPVRLEGLVKGMLEQQQQVRFEDFQRRERDQEMREQGSERHQEEDYHFSRERSAFPQEILCPDSMVTKMDCGRII